ncbi:MAG: division/cell wall cluster transcriptional repressor MraZ [Candidatus Harrisonbacteria bacterium]|nr:division/cell wall cluster transcriptional repressor MraZ [Candidatus Harrisonbacteria bacterium]
MFIGEYQHTLDEKGRMAIPQKFRGAFTSGAVVTRGLDGCLFIYPMTEWQNIAEKLMSLPITKGDARAFARHMLSGAMEVSLDSQGRVLLPEYLREYAGVRKEAVIAGLYNRLEVWSSETWGKYQAETEKSAEAIAENLEGFSI